MFIQKVTVNTYNGKVRIIKIFNYPLFLYTKNNKRRNFYLYSSYKKKFCGTYKGKKEVFYLKINRMESYAIRCVQHWVNIVYEYGCDFYLVCDNNKLKDEIIKKVCFKDLDIKFIKSVRNQYVDNLQKNISTKLWVKATFAHLTPFYHSKKNNFDSFWNIDADDTMFCLYPNQVSELLKKARDYSKEYKIDAFSFDMHTSRTHGIHWSFGVTYINNNKNYFSILESNKDVSWRNDYLNYDYDFNLDWFFTYLRDAKILNNKTFFFNDIIFIHYGDFISNPIGSGVSIFYGDVIKYPFLLDIFNYNKLGLISVNSRCIKLLNYNTIDDCYKFMCNTQTYLEIPSLPRDNMWNI